MSQGLHHQERIARQIERDNQKPTEQIAKELMQERYEKWKQEVRKALVCNK